MGEHQLDPADIHADRHRAGAAFGALAPEVDDELPVDLGKPRLPDRAPQMRQRLQLGAPGRLLGIGEVVDMQVDQVGQGRFVGDTSLFRRLVFIDRALLSRGPKSRVLAQLESLAYMTPSFRWMMARQAREGRSTKGGHFRVRHVNSEKSDHRENLGTNGYYLRFRYILAH